MLRIGNNLMEAAFRVRHRKGVVAAARHLQSRGINYELAMLALLGGSGARRHGIEIVNCHSATRTSRYRG